MKSRFLFLLAGISFMLTAAAQSDTVRFDRFSVVFPAKPTSVGLGTNMRHQLRLADSSAIFQALQIDMSDQGMDEATVLMMQAEPAFWEQTRDGIVAQLGGDTKLIKDEMLDWKGTKIMQMHLERPSKEGGVNKLTLRMLFLGTHMIQYGHTNRNDKADAALRDAFLASLQIK
ncbi:MAG: hypothetical protein RL750_655 [Bacteroidota bacterium]|jgi:hypothetical protein